jgi:hypothetical protein
VPLASYALCSYQDVLDQLGESSYRQPGRIEALINSASWQIISYAGREFKPLSSSTVRSFPISADGYVYLGGNEALTITQVRANTEGTSPTTLAATDYQKIVAANGSTIGIQLLRNYSNAFSPLTGYAEITGTWGWTTVPPDISELCAWQVKEWIRRGAQIRSTAGGADSGETAIASYTDLSYSARHLLDRYRQPVVA